MQPQPAHLEIELPDDLHEQILRIAESRGTTIGETVLEMLLRDLLDQQTIG